MSSQEQFGVQTNVEAQHCTGWRDISSAERDEDTYILASVNGKVWFQCSWDEEDQCWVTFNRYYEDDRHPKLMPPAPRAFRPTLWAPLPSSEEQPIKSSERQRAEGKETLDTINPNPLPPDIKEIVAWRVKDFADGWIIYQTESAAAACRAETGGLMEPLYPASALLSLAGEREEWKAAFHGEWANHAATIVRENAAIAERDEARRERVEQWNLARERLSSLFVEQAANEALQRRALLAEKQLAEAVRALETLRRQVSSNGAIRMKAPPNAEANWDAALKAAAAVVAQHQSPQSSNLELTAEKEGEGDE